MRSLPLAARCYLIAIWSLAAVFILVHVLFAGTSIWQLLLLLLWVPLFVFADYFEASFEVGDGNRATMTITDAAMIFLVAVVGANAIFIIALGTYIVGALRRHDWYRNLFNVAHRSVTYQVMVLAYVWMNPTSTLPFSGLLGFSSLVVIGSIDYVLNLLFVATIIALTTRHPLLDVYRDSFRQVSWVYLVTMPVGAILAALWNIDRWLLLPGVLPLVMAYLSFKALAGWQAESQRSKDLAHEARQLASKVERLQDATTAMIASLEPMPLLKTVSTRLAALLESSASWVILLDQQRAHLVATNGIPADFDWDAPGYVAEIHRGLRVLDADDLRRLNHSGAAHWQSLVIIPLALEQHILGGICLANEEPIVLLEDDRRVLLSFAAQAALAMEHARLFDELRYKQDELVRSSKLAALGTFSAGIAHEFNNLLAGILGYAQLGLNSDDVADKNEALEVAVRSCMRGRSITGGLLTFARRGEPQRGLHMVQEAIEDVIVLVERELAKNNIRIERNIQTVPPTICDPGQIAQVMLNLMTNARDALLEQGGGLITVSLSQANGQIVISVSDTGCGIPEHLLDQVFQPFMTTKGALGGSVTPGAGLGLAISYGIVQNHNGTITIDSKEGAGTVVTVGLPIINDKEMRNSKDLAAVGICLRILLVDDEQMVADSIERLLKAQGHQVVSSLDGATALRYYCEQPFDLVLSDIIMPGMSGAEFVQRLRAIDPAARILIMTGNMAQSQIEGLLQDGAIGVINKPFVIEELMEAVSRSFDIQLAEAQRS